MKKNRKKIGLCGSKKNIGKKYDDTKDIKEFYLKMEDKK